jgi:hypothetical protein
LHLWSREKRKKNENMKNHAHKARMEFSEFFSTQWKGINWTKYCFSVCRKNRQLLYIFQSRNSNLTLFPPEMHFFQHFILTSHPYSLAVKTILNKLRYCLLCSRSKNWWSARSAISTTVPPKKFPRSNLHRQK